MAPGQFRILQVSPWSVHGGGTGGMAAVVRDLSVSLREAGHHVDILANSWEAPRPIRDETELRLRLPGPPRADSAMPRLKWPIHRERAARALAALCRRERVDVLHAHFASPYLATLARARTLGAPPYLVTCHGGDVLAMSELDNNQQRAVYAGMHAASAHVAVSRWLAGEAEAAFGLDQVATIPNGFKAPWAKVPSRTQLEERLGLSLPRQYAVMVANMRRYKGHEVALNAWKILQDETDLPLVMVGGGPDYDSTKSLAKSLGLGERVVFLGHVDRETSVGVMAYSDLVVGPSQNEGQGLFALEAGALQRPLVCSAIPPLLDIVDDGISALTFNSGSPVELADAVLRLHSEPGLATTIGANLRKKVEEQFSFQAMLRQYVALYSGICQL